MCVCTNSMTYPSQSQHSRPQLATAPVCVPDQAGGFLSCGKLLLPSRPQHETEREAYWSLSRSCAAGQTRPKGHPLAPSQTSGAMPSPRCGPRGKGHHSEPWRLPPYHRLTHQAALSPERLPSGHPCSPTQSRDSCSCGAQADREVTWATSSRTPRASNPQHTR